MGTKCWVPKLSEMPEQCSSCPFRIGNNEEFGKIVERLRKKHGVKGRMTNMHVFHARMMIMEDLKRIGSGDFICHSTVYDPSMAARSPGEHKQCPGATAWFRSNCADAAGSKKPKA